MSSPINYTDMIRPGPSSQTTSSWHMIAPEGAEISVVGFSLNAGGVIIGTLQERSWNEVMEQVLQQRAQTWKELAAL
jgi:hypothetical protein